MRHNWLPEIGNWLRFYKRQMEGEQAMIINLNAKMDKEWCPKQDYKHPKCQKSDAEPYRLTMRADKTDTSTEETQVSMV
jgi:hypothetical protein